MNKETITLYYNETDNTITETLSDYDTKRNAVKGLSRYITEGLENSGQFLQNGFLTVSYTPIDVKINTEQPTNIGDLILKTIRDKEHKGVDNLMQIIDNPENWILRDPNNSLDYEKHQLPEKIISCYKLNVKFSEHNHNLIILPDYSDEEENEIPIFQFKSYVKSLMENHELTLNDCDIEIIISFPDDINLLE